jgi:hypothetical protein
MKVHYTEKLTAMWIGDSVRTCYKRSNTTANPIPPPAQREATPILRFSEVKI